ncbi:hypothetical protein SteCoe_20325 [Stentor coeruleus]|uniref:Uncharacterized protein n=1 Tax=Stentor coeruleus TaxID=5963 RepID=A0A1R2BSC4_9CILI|nr:hypothetical protein SteCoe_20325 [Stentor coeruleus]
MQLNQISLSKKGSHLSDMNSLKGTLRYKEKKIIVLRRLKSDTRQKINISWIEKLMNWRSILEDQKEYRHLITKIELYNQKLTNGKRRRLSPK